MYKNMSDIVGMNWKATAVTVSAAAVSGALASYAWKEYVSRKALPQPKKWIRVGTVKDLILYPVKSCKGVSVPEAMATNIGLKVSEVLRDRVFMVVDSRRVFQTQRTLPKMTLIHVSVEGNRVTLSGEAMQSLTFLAPENKPGLRKSCRIFEDRVREALDCGDEVGKWLDTFLDQTGFRLLYHYLETTQRARTPLQKKFPTFLAKDKGAFQDQTSYMIIAEESVTDLNTRLDSPVTYRNFRPSILIHEIPEPFAEDFWTFVRIGNQMGPIFKASKPCTRCRLTTVNPDTGVFNESGEPLKTLTEKMKRSFEDETVDRLVKNQGVIGLQLGLFKEGVSIKVGDAVYAAAM